MITDTICLVNKKYKDSHNTIFVDFGKKLARSQNPFPKSPNKKSETEQRRLVIEVDKKNKKAYSEIDFQDYLNLLVSKVNNYYTHVTFISHHHSPMAYYNIINAIDFVNRKLNVSLCAYNHATDNGPSNYLRSLHYIDKSGDVTYELLIHDFHQEFDNAFKNSTLNDLKMIWYATGAEKYISLTPSAELINYQKVFYNEPSLNSYKNI